MRPLTTTEKAWGAVIVGAVILVGTGRYLTGEKAAIRKCRTALDAFPQTRAVVGNYGASDLAAVVHQNCAGFVHDPDCRKGLDMVKAQPGYEAIGTILATCRAGYCANSERIDACLPTSESSLDEKEAAWSHLLELILVRDTGEDAASLRAALLSAESRVPAIAPDPLLTERRGLQAYLWPDGTIVLGTRRERMIATVQLAELEKYLRGRPDLTKLPGVIISTGNQVDRHLNTEVKAAFERAGLRKVLFSFAL